MSITLGSLRKLTATAAPRCLIYGAPGLGKTTLASEFPSAVFIQIEDGTPAGIEIDSFGQLGSYDEVMDSIAALYSDEHSFRTVAVDSLDKFEPLVQEKCCKDNNWENIEAPGYGKGYAVLDKYWREFFGAISGLRSRYNMASVFIAHAAIGTFPNPSGTEYPRWDIRLHKRALNIVQDEVDAILMVGQEASVKVDKGSHGSERAHASGGSGRWIYCDGRPSWVAKNRYGMPEKIPYKKDAGFSVMSEYFPKFW